MKQTPPTRRPSRSGLPPVGMEGAALDTPRSDTKRDAFPTLATKGSVFAWTPQTPTLYSTGAGATGTTVTVNLRNNTATNGSSVDIPTWAAGAVLSVSFAITALGVGVVFQYVTIAPPYPYSLSGFSFWVAQFPAANTSIANTVIVPFFDDPTFVVTMGNSAGNTNGTVQTTIQLIGFVRNV